MFQGHPETLSLSFPSKGINSAIKNNIEYAKYIQNLLVGDNNSGMLRCGTALVSSFPYTPNKIYRDVISIMSFLKSDGTSEKLVYVQYLIPLPSWFNFTIETIANKPGFTKATITLSNLTQVQKDRIRQIIFNGVYLHFENVNKSAGAEITNFIDTISNISFEIPLSLDFLQSVIFVKFIERAGLYRVKNDNNYELIKDDLDPCVIISFVNFRGKLLIANGIDPIQVYDGINATPLTSPVSIPASLIECNGTAINFTIENSFLVKVLGALDPGYTLNLLTNTTEETVIITAKEVVPIPSTTKSKVYLTVIREAGTQTILNIKKILYQVLCPSFSFLTVIHKRLWALAPGRSFQNQFRPPDLAMRVFYSASLDTIDDWFNQQTNEIDFIDIAGNSEIPDNLEAIASFENKILFLGRETTQVWVGEDPTTSKDGKNNIILPDFKYEQTLQLGILQKNLYLQLPNSFLMISNNGIAAINSLNVADRLQISSDIATPVAQYIKNQLANVRTDREYRTMKAFLYSYGRFAGFKIKYSCFIYQLIGEGFWTIFSENFANSTSIFYDATSKNLYLGLPDGKLIVYTDKNQTKSYLEYNVTKLSWSLHYNWLYLQNTWTNTHIYIDTDTLSPININIRIYINQDQTKSIAEKIFVKKEGILYDMEQFGIKPYPANDIAFAHELVEFTAESLLLEITGLSNDFFSFNTTFLAGGSNKLNY